MFVKYEKTHHVFPVTSKKNLSKKEVQQLLNGYAVVEEKMDGANVGIIRHKDGFHLQKRGSLVGPSEHAQFQRFHAWANNEAYGSIMSLPEGVILYGEWLYCVHNIYYDRLPTYFLAFDALWDGEWCDVPALEELCDTCGFHMVPIIAEGYFTKKTLLNLVPEKSKYGDRAEGIVVKRYTKKKYLRGKIVRPDFLEKLEESDHWTKGSLRTNKIG